MRWIKRYSFLVMIVATSLIFGCGKVISSIEEQSSEEMIQENKAETELTTEQSDKNTTNSSAVQKDENRAEIEISEEEQQIADSTATQEEENLAASTTEENLSVTPLEGEKEEESKKKEFRTVERSYLDDALFIGNSRTDTLYRYAGWEKTDFFVKTGINIWEVLEERMYGKSLEEMLLAKQYKKIYMMFGINELEIDTAEGFRQQYEEVLAKIKELQPEAVIFVQSIIHITAQKDEERKDLSNEVIDIRNAELQKLADNETVFWLDINEVFDEAGTGSLSTEYTFDGIHLKAKNIERWETYLLEHGI